MLLTHKNFALYLCLQVHHASNSPGISIWGPRPEKAPKEHEAHNGGALYFSIQVQCTLIGHHYPYT